MNYKDFFKSFNNFINEKDEDCEGVNKPCGCVDSSIDLSIEKIQEFLAKKYGTGDKGLKITYSGRFGNGIQGEPDGVCGSETRKFIMMYQDEKGVCEDACVGEITFGKMKEDDPEFFENDEESASVGKLSGSTASSFATSNFAGVSSSTSQISAAPEEIKDGVTIVIKSNQPSRTPSSYYLKGKNRNSNFQGYGRDTSNHDRKKNRYAKVGNKENDAYFVNGEDLQLLLKNTPSFKATRRPGAQHGHKDVAEVIDAAAREVHAAVPSTSGLATLGQASLSRCINRKERIKNNNLPCIQGGWGPGLGAYRWGHQSGLEVDVFYYYKGNLYPGKYTNSSKRLFDMERNAIFTESLLADPRVEAVLVGVTVIEFLYQYASEPNNKSRFPNIISNYKNRLAPAGKGHDDHWHIRLHIPEGSPNMNQFKNKYLPKEPGSKDTLIRSKLGSGAAKFNHIDPDPGLKWPKNFDNRIEKIFNLLKDRSLDEIVKLYGGLISISVGNAESKVPDIYTYKKDRAIYGASSPKTMAALAQIIHYKGKSEALTDEEIGGILTYTQRRTGKGPYSSNKINRAISIKHKNRTVLSRGFNAKQKILNKSLPPEKRKKLKKIYYPYVRKKGIGLGRIGEQEVRKHVQDPLGLSRRSTFTWGTHKQTTEDMFKFFAALQRMTSGKSTGTELQWYNQHKSEVDKIVRIQKTRAHSPRMTHSGIPKFAAPGIPDDKQGWGKGGRDGGTVSHTFIIPKGEERYVISVYVNSIPKSKMNDSEAYAVLNALIYRIIEEKLN